MMQADAFAAEYSQVVAAVEVLHALGVLLAQLLLQGIFVFVGAGTASLFEVEVGLGQNWVLLDYFVQNVDVEWKSLG